MSMNFGGCNATVVGMAGSMGGSTVSSSSDCATIAVGVPGPSTGGSVGASSLTMTGTAAVALGGHRAVYRRADGLIDYASADDLACMHESIWITTGAAALGDDVIAVVFGE